MNKTIAPVSPCPLARAMITTLATSMATSSITPTSARPPARRPTPGGNRNTGRSRRCSRQVGGSATTTRAAMPTVVPTASTSSAEAGSWASERPLFKGHEDQVAGDQDEAREARADGRRGEPAVRLQQPAQDDRDPVQQGLGSEDPQHVAGRGDHVRVDAVRVRVAGVQQRGDRPGGHHDDQDQRHRDDNGPGQQRRGDLADPRLLGRVADRAARPSGPAPGPSRWLAHPPGPAGRGDRGPGSR